MGWGDVFSAAAGAAIGIGAEHIKKSYIQPTGDSPAPAHSDGCPACGIHRELAEAERLMAGVVRAFEREGVAPPERRAVVLLVANGLKTARQKLQQAVTQRPQIAFIAENLSTCLDEAERTLPDREETRLADWTYAAEKVKRCWETADDLAGDWFKPVAIPADEDLRDKVRAMSPEARRELREMLGD